MDNSNGYKAEILFTSCKLVKENMIYTINFCLMPLIRCFVETTENGQHYLNKSCKL